MLSARCWRICHVPSSSVQSLSLTMLSRVGEETVGPRPSKHLCWTARTRGAQLGCTAITKYRTIVFADSRIYACRHCRNLSPTTLRPTTTLPVASLTQAISTRSINSKKKVESPSSTATPTWKMLTHILLQTIIGVTQAARHGSATAHSGQILIPTASSCTSVRRLTPS